MFEWQDPVTGETHRCPKVFMEIRHFVGYGEQSAMHCGVLLRKLGMVNSEPNRRHLRKAVYILRNCGTPIVSTRSKSGGYYIPRTKAEVEQHCSLQEKLAHSMLEGAAQLRNMWNPRPPDGQGDLFDEPA